LENEKRELMEEGAIKKEGQGNPVIMEKMIHAE
jgi:hypothetical protein